MGKIKEQKRYRKSLTVELPNGEEVPAEQFVWQDPVPAVDHPLVGAKDTAALKAKLVGIQRGDAPDPHGWVRRIG